MLDHKLHTKPLKFFVTVNRTELKWLILNIIFYDGGSGAILLAIYFLGRLIDNLNNHAGPVAGLAWLIILCVVLYEAMYRLGHICEVILLTRIRSKIKKTLFDHT